VPLGELIVRQKVIDQEHLSVSQLGWCGRLPVE